MLVSPLVHAVRHELKRRDQSEQDQTANHCEVIQAGLGHRITSFRLEADVLERLGGVPVQTSRQGIVATTACQVTLRDPRACTMTG